MWYISSDSFFSDRDSGSKLRSVSPCKPISRVVMILNIYPGKRKNGSLLALAIKFGASEILWKRVVSKVLIVNLTFMRSYFCTIIKRLNVRDNLCQVDGQPLEGYNNHQAVELLRNTGSVVRLKLARYKHAPTNDQLQQYDGKYSYCLPLTL